MDTLDRRTQLIDETISLVGRYGYNGFTLKMLAGQCGMSETGDSDSDAVANVLIAVMYGLTVQWLRADQDFDIETEWERALRLILRAASPKSSTSD
ncbi:MAG TPA: hypothetical protein VF475_12120 [Sphingobium sp.]